VVFWVVLVLLNGLACVSPSRPAGLSQTSVGPDPLNSSYLVEGATFTLQKGRAERPAAPGSVTRSRISLAGQPVSADLNGDGVSDAVVLLVHDPGGSGTFSYVAAAVGTEPGYRGTNAVLVGDRITAMDLRVEGRTVVVTYADRSPADSFATRPSVVRSKHLVLRDSTLADTREPASR
jgi:hypothetical protein